MKNTNPLYQPERYTKRRAYDSPPWAGWLALFFMGICFGVVVGVTVLADTEAFVCPEEMRCIPENEIRRFEVPQ